METGDTPPAGARPFGAAKIGWSRRYLKPVAALSAGNAGKRLWAQPKRGVQDASKSAESADFPGRQAAEPVLEDGECRTINPGKELRSREKLAKHEKRLPNFCGFDILANF